MADIKELDESVDTSELECHYYDWDVIVGDEQYAVFNFPGYNHSIGGKRGENSLYCCKISIMKCDHCAKCRDKSIDHSKIEENAMEPKNVFSCCKNFKPKGKDLISFTGESCSWEINVKSRNFIGKGEVRHVYLVNIMRNGKQFYSIRCHDMDWGIAKARSMLTDIWEHSIPFSHRNYQKEIINRKIFYNGYPAIVTSYDEGEGRVTVKPDNEVCEYVIGYDGSKYVDPFPEDMFCNRIFWWRSEEDTEEWIGIHRAMSVKTNFPMIKQPVKNEYVGDFHA